jgi:tetratricopeptide (TPR) repeat protein
VAGIPTTIEGLGNAGQKPRPNPKFDPTKGTGLTSQDFYVFSRIDGATSIRDLVLMTGLGAEQTIAILKKLRGQGAFLLDGETAEDVAKLVAPAPAPEPADDEELELTGEELAAMAEDVAIKEADRILVIRTMRAVRAGDHYRVLGVARDANKKTLKRAYFKLSKKFHPDRYYNKETGSFGPWLSQLFEAATQAWDVLGDDRKRSVYDGGGTGGGTRAQTKEEHALELFERATTEEGQGHYANALKLFAGAARAHARPRYMRRAATCAIKADKLEEAERWAREALELRREDPSYWRVLADVLRAADRLDDALEVLVQAAEIRTENDSLASEILNDLEAVKVSLGYG